MSDAETTRFVESSIAALRTDPRFAMRPQVDRVWEALRGVLGIDPAVRVCVTVLMAGTAIAAVLVMLRVWHARSSDKLRAVAAAAVAAAAMWIESAWSWP